MSNKINPMQVTMDRDKRTDAASRPSDKNVGINQDHQVSPRLGLVNSRNFVTS